jgi:hypothetical protein
MKVLQPAGWPRPKGYSNGISAHGAQGVVLVHLRDAEDGHDGVADELLDGAAVPLDHGAHRLVVAGHDRSELLGVHALAHIGGAGHVGEDDRDDLPLVDRRAIFERRAAELAEPSQL